MIQTRAALSSVLSLNAPCSPLSLDQDKGADCEPSCDPIPSQHSILEIPLTLTLNCCYFTDFSHTSFSQGSRGINYIRGKRDACVPPCAHKNWQKRRESKPSPILPVITSLVEIWVCGNEKVGTLATRGAS